MEIYRITLAKWTNKLVASGRPARWNSNGMQMIYAAENRSLACLENVVHRGSEGLNLLYKVMVISIPDSLEMEIVPTKKLPVDWKDSARCPICRAYGDEWLKSFKSVVLRVPSAIVKNEYNYLLNPMHPDFDQVKLVRTEEFEFDKRINDAMMS